MQLGRLDYPVREDAMWERLRAKSLKGKYLRDGQRKF